MADMDQRSGTDRRDADGRSGTRSGMRPGNRPGFSLGRTALTGWALAAVLGLAGFGTAVGATPVPVADTAPLGGFGTVVRGSAPGVDPGTVPTDGPVVNRVAVAGPAIPILPMDTVTAASVPTPAAGVPTGTVAAPGAGSPDLAVGGTPPATGATVPAGPAAQLRQAAFTAAAPDQRASFAIRTALAQIGLPYVWGGDGPTNGDAGFDCSGLTTFSYGSAGVPLPRTAHTQYNAGPHVPGGAPLQPGDLVFYGTSARVHHVGMYLGAGRMVNAPTFGKPVQVAFYRYRGDDYLGATRPAAAGGSLTTGVLPYVDPLPAVPDVALAPAQRQQQAQERVFRAPTASLPAVLPQPGDATLPPEQQSAARSIAESDAVAPARAAAPQSIVGPVAPPVRPGSGSNPVAGTTTASSAPVTTAPAAPPAATSPGASASNPAGPAGSATSSTATTVPAVPPAGSPAPITQAPATQAPVAQAPVAQSPAPQVPAPQAPATSSASPVVVETASGSTTATTTLAPTSTVRTTTPKATTSKVAKPVVPRTTTPTTATKRVTSPTTAKAVTTTAKPAKTEDDDPTTTKTSASKTSASKTGTSKTKTAEEEKTSEEKTSAEKSSSSDEGDD
jgi:cell wall-associated NlpC family hydrolase